MEQPKIVVVGAGISGTKAAIDFAGQGYAVFLVDKSPANGGLLSLLDHQFPNNHCGMCRILPMIERDQEQEFCLRKGLFHKNIHLMRLSEVHAVEGQPGQLKVSIISQPTGVNPEKCSGCGHCEAICPISIKDSFNGNLSTKKAISLPVPHMTANSRVIDWAACTRCNQCADTCPENAISLDDAPTEMRLEHVAAVVLTTGIDLYDPTGIDVYGYGTLENVVTAGDFERMISSSGPYGGQLKRPSDTKPVKKIGWIQCVGSRNVMLGADFCSNVCCMFAVKQAILAQSKIDNAETAIFYMDMRTFGRDYQRYRDQAEKEKGVRFVRCRVHSVYPHEATGDLILSHVDAKGALVEEPFDLVVLSTGRRAEQAACEWENHEGVFKPTDLPGFKDIADSITGVMSLSERVGRLLNSKASAALPSKTGEKGKPSFAHAIIDSEKTTREMINRAEPLQAKRLVLTAARPVTPKALIIGAGPAGLTASRLLALNGIEVILVEKSEHLGGNLSNIAEDDTTVQIVKTLTEIQNDAKINVMTRSEVISKTGVPGRFDVTVKNHNSGAFDKIRCGAIILATGGRRADTMVYALGEHERVVTGFELADRINKDASFRDQPPARVAMIQCAGSREEPFNYCSRICCLKSLNNAIALKTKQPDTHVYIFYRDMMTYGESEKYYTQARKMGVIFIPFDLTQKPVVRIENDLPVVEGIDPLSGEQLALEVDLVVVATGLVPHETDGLKTIFGFETTRDGFIQEADPKWRPVDTGREGIFVCGLSKGPLRLAETILEAEAATQRALSLLNRDTIEASPVSAFVRQAICSRCERCIAVCPYGARYYEDGRILVDPVSCQGCGACATECPNNATLIKSFEDDGIMNALEVLL